MKLLRKLAIVTVIVITLTSVSWGVVYASAPALIKLYPGEGAAVGTAKPRISIKWLNIPGVKIKTIKLILDDQELDLAPPASGTDFVFRPPRALAQGRHDVRVVVTYAMGAARQIDKSWKFTVDTQPPPLGFATGDPFHVIASPEAKLTIMSEPGARIGATFNGAQVAVDDIERDGTFSIQIKASGEENRLQLTASDTVGNHRAVTLPVILDETTPVIEHISPAEGEVLRLAAPKVEVAFVEKESGLRSIKLSIDGTQAVVKGDDGTDRVAYLGDLLTDGPHKAKVEAVDYAGHKVEKEWNFTVDTRRIVVSRAARRLYFYQYGALQRVFPVAVGMPGYSTPAGRWRIVNKQYNPSWINPGSPWAKDMPKVIPPSWSNPLGVRALALNARNILIHGTSNYASMGRAASHGCIRMRNSDIVNFFPEVGVGVTVDIL